MGQFFKALFGGGGGGGESKAAPAPTPAAAPAPGAKSTITGAAVAPGTSQDQFKKSQEAYFQQLLSGTGQGSELPAGIQSNIERQAALIQ